MEDHAAELDELNARDYKYCKKQIYLQKFQHCKIQNAAKIFFVT